MAKKKIRIFEGFAGYGGASFGLKRLKENLPGIDYEIVGYSELDKYAASLFDANHKDKKGISPSLLIRSIYHWEKEGMFVIA